MSSEILIDPGTSGSQGYAAPIEGSPEAIPDYGSQFAQVMAASQRGAPPSVAPNYSAAFAAAVAPSEQRREDVAALRGQEAPDAWLQQVIAAMGGEPTVDDFAIADETRDRARQIASGAWQDPETHYEGAREQQRRTAMNAPISEYEPGGSAVRTPEWARGGAGGPALDPWTVANIGREHQRVNYQPGSNTIGEAVARAAAPAGEAIGGALGTLGEAMEQSNATVKSVVGSVAKLDPAYAKRYADIAAQIAAQSGLSPDDWRVQANAARVLYDEIPAAFEIFGISNKAILEAVLDPFNLVGAGFEGHLIRGLVRGAKAATSMTRSTARAFVDEVKLAVLPDAVVPLTVLDRAGEAVVRAIDDGIALDAEQLAARIGATTPEQQNFAARLADAIAEKVRTSRLATEETGMARLDLGLTGKGDDAALTGTGMNPLQIADTMANEGATSAAIVTKLIASGVSPTSAQDMATFALRSKAAKPEVAATVAREGATAAANAAEKAASEAAREARLLVKHQIAAQTGRTAEQAAAAAAPPKKGAPKTAAAKAAQAAGAERKLDEAIDRLPAKFREVVRQSLAVGGKTSVSPEAIVQRHGDVLRKALEDAGAKGRGPRDQQALARRLLDREGGARPIEPVANEPQLPGPLPKRDAAEAAARGGREHVPGVNVASANRRVPQTVKDALRRRLRENPDLARRALTGQKEALEKLLDTVPGGRAALRRAFEEEVPQGTWKTRDMRRTTRDMVHRIVEEENAGNAFSRAEFGDRTPPPLSGKTAKADPPLLALPEPRRGVMRQSDAQAQIAQRRFAEAQQRRWAKEAAIAEEGADKAVARAIALQRRRIWRRAAGAPTEAIAMSPSKTHIAPPHIRQVVWNDLPTIQKVKTLYNTSRALKAMGDISATMRQGGILLVDALISKDPVRGMKLIRTELQAFKDPQYAVRSMREIVHHPRFRELVTKMDLKITTWEGIPEDVVRVLEETLPPGSGRLLREEEFQANALEMLIRLPGGRKVALRGLSDVSDMSNRAFASYLNAQRWQKALNYVELREATSGPLGDAVLHDLGRVINAWTGRGVMPGGGINNALLNAIFFAPSFAISRGQLFVEPFISITKGLRAPNEMLQRQYFDLAREQAIVMGKWSGAMVGMVTLFDQIPGVDVGTDTRSADFLSLKVGTPTGGQLVFDPLGGTRTIINIASRIATASTVSSRTGEETDLMEDSSLLGVMDFIESFVEGKLHPTISASLKAVSRKDPYTKKPFGPLGDKEYNDLYDPRAWVARPEGYPEVASEMFTPLLIADAIEAMVSGDGLDVASIPYGLMSALASGVGLGVQEYEPKKKAGGQPVRSLRGYTPPSGKTTSPTKKATAAPPARGGGAGSFGNARNR